MTFKLGHMLKIILNMAAATKLWLATAFFIILECKGDGTKKATLKFMGKLQ